MGRARVLLVALPPTLAVAYAWTRLEQAPDWRLTAAAAALGLVPIALVGVSRGRAAVVAGAVLAAALAVSAWPGRDGTWLADAVAAAERGLQDFYRTSLPFDAGAHTEMRGLVLAAVFAFTLAIALAAAWGRPLVCSAGAAVGVCWPVTIAPGRDTIAAGSLALAATLWPPLAARARSRRSLVPALAGLLAVVVVASAAADAGMRPTRSALAWQQWTLFDNTATAAGVELVWDTNYSGISFPDRATTVLRIRAPHRALYWRASTLDTFVDDRWIEDLYPVTIDAAARRLPDSRLRPATARSQGSWVEQQVEVAALVDDHVVAATEPMQVQGADLERLVYFEGGVMRAVDQVAAGDRYTVWSAAPQPTPAQLVRSPARYPAEVGRYLRLGRTVTPPFGTAGRARTVDALFEDERYQALWPYRGVWKQAQAVAGRAATPYEATIALERWLRSRGGFQYDERPPRPVGVPPLVDFLERSKLGYCQHFAGSMALMLRLLGVPSRVAVGFTSGTWKEGVWTVTDHDAHAWVEVWLAGYGWLPFDPTPGRGRLTAAYTNASDSADAVRALGTGRFLDFSGAGGLGDAPRRRPTAEPAPSSPAWPYIAPVALAVLLLGGLAGVKRWRRRRAYRSDDPRLRASAARAELAGFLRDQGADVPSDADVAPLRRELVRLGVRADGFAAAFSRARYGPPEGAATAAAEARGELADVLRALRAGLGPGRRIRGFLAVRSLRGS